MSVSAFITSKTQLANPSNSTMCSLESHIIWLLSRPSEKYWHGGCERGFRRVICPSSWSHPHCLWRQQAVGKYPCTLGVPHPPARKEGVTCMGEQGWQVSMLPNPPTWAAWEGTMWPENSTCNVLPWAAAKYSEDRDFTVSSWVWNLSLFLLECSFWRCMQLCLRELWPAMTLCLYLIHSQKFMAWSMRGELEYMIHKA